MAVMEDLCFPPERILEMPQRRQTTSSCVLTAQNGTLPVSCVSLGWSLQRAFVSSHPCWRAKPHRARCLRFWDEGEQKSRFALLAQDGRGYCLLLLQTSLYAKQSNTVGLPNHFSINFSISAVWESAKSPGSSCLLASLQRPSPRVLTGLPTGEPLHTLQGRVRWSSSSVKPPDPLGPSSVFQPPTPITVLSTSPSATTCLSVCLLTGLQSPGGHQLPDQPPSPSLATQHPA